MIDPEELLKLKAAVGMFHLEGDTIHAMSGRVAHIFPHNPFAQENAAYIVAACNHAPELAEEVKTLRQALVVMSVHLAGACTGKCGKFRFCETCDLSNGRNCADNVLAWHVDKFKEAPNGNA